MERRDFLKWTGGVLAIGTMAGCLPQGAGGAGQVLLPDAPELDYPRTGLALRPGLPQKSLPKSPSASMPGPELVPGPCHNRVAAITRKAWGAGSPVSSKLNQMGAVRQITIHHEGNPSPNYATNMTEVARCLRKIQSEHRRRMNAGDIGYHYIVDRAGRVWEGRSVRYQGAHVKYHNPHNIGIMMLGNFDIQVPSNNQMVALERLTHMLLFGYRLPVTTLKGHGQLANTRCPGQHVLARLARLQNTLLRA